MVKKNVLKKDELISKVSEITKEQKKTCADIIQAVPEVITEALVENLPKKDEITVAPIPGIGTIGIKYKEAQKRVNNLGKDGKKTECVVPAHYATCVKISKSFKVAINKDLVKKPAEKSEKKASKKTA